MPPTSVSARSVTWLWPPMLLIALVAGVLTWWFVALLSGRPAGWMAVFAALELAFMLRLGALRGSGLRIALTLAGTVLVAVAANWGIVSSYVGQSLGLDPWNSALRMGPHMAWTLVQLSSGVAEAMWLGVALVVGWFTAR
jgi:hypothetical protein